MPKIKTSRAIAKRFRVTKNNKVMRRKAGKNHLLEKKSPDRKRVLSKRTLTDSSDAKNLVTRLPYF